MSASRDLDCNTVYLSLGTELKYLAKEIRFLGRLMYSKSEALVQERNSSMTMEESGLASGSVRSCDHVI